MNSYNYNEATMQQFKIFLLASMAIFFIACGGGGNTETNKETVKETVESEIPNDDTLQSEKPNVIIIFTDDMGYADLGIQNQRMDVKTPNIDSIARNGVRMTNGYITAPQCTPSRAGMITGQYQQRFGVDDNRYTPMPLDVKTLGEHFQSIGYHTGMVGKWHLEIDQNSKEWIKSNYPDVELSEFKTNMIPLDIKKKYFPNHRGYTDTYFGYNKHYWTTFDTEGHAKTESYIQNNAYRLDAVSDAAVAFIKRNKDVPFYLHVAHYAPHVPLEATKKYLDRFSDVDIQRRKYALAMISAVDDGVGRILNTLAKYEILENTIIFFISDNGAPLGLDMTDTPIDNHQEAWDGSMNTPLVGEKGMLTDGGIRVPFLMQWSGKIAAGQTFDKPVISLDAAYTALKASGASTSTLGQLDGIDLLPALTGSSEYLNNRALFWRFWSQGAVRVGRWKYISMGKNLEYLFDMYSDEHEEENLILSSPEKAEELKKLLQEWKGSLYRQPGDIEIDNQEKTWYDYFLD